jgi:hypothetical protein
MCPMPNGVNLVQVGQLKVFSLGENGSEAGSPPGMLKQRACKSSRTAMRACGRDSSLYGRYDARCATRRRISAAPGSNASCEIGEAASPGHGLAAWLQGTGSWHAGGLAWPGLAWLGLREKLLQVSSCVWPGGSDSKPMHSRRRGLLQASCVASD